MAQFYRYTSESERQFISNTSSIRSRSGITFFAIGPPSIYDVAEDVMNLLAVSDVKRFRIGPIPEDEMPPLDHVAPRTVSPKQLRSGNWVSGGGTEAATTYAVRLYGAVELR